MSNTERRALQHALGEALGARRAEIMMELLPPLGWADVARQPDLVAIRGEMAELRGEMAELRAELKGEMAELRAELKGEMADLRGEMAELRGEMAELRAEVQAQVPKFILANVPIMFATAGLVLAAAKLA